MPIRFGSQIVALDVYETLLAIPAVTNTVTRIVNLPVAPPLVDLPVALHYMESGTYDGPIGSAATSQVLRYVVRFSCEGESTDPIQAAADAAFDAFDPREIDRSGVYLGYLMNGLWPIETVLEDGKFYRQLGFYLEVHLTQGG